MLQSTCEGASLSTRTSLVADGSIIGEAPDRNVKVSGADKVFVTFGCIPCSTYAY
jgi:hypothetical protein